MNRSKLSLTFTAIVLMSVPFSAAQESEQEIHAGYEEQIKVFFDTATGGDYKKAVEGLYADNPWIAGAMDQVNALKGQLIMLPDVAGEFHGYELLVEKKFSDLFVYRWYIVAYDRTPISFHFTYYKPDDRWMIFSFEFREDLKSVAEELAKMDLLYTERNAGDPLDAQKALASTS